MEKIKSEKTNEGLEENLHYLPRFSNYFIRQWAPIIVLISATIIKFVKNQEVLQNNQAAESYFAVLKTKTMNQPHLEERNLGDFSKSRKVWEFHDFISSLCKRNE